MSKTYEEQLKVWAAKKIAKEPSEIEKVQLEYESPYGGCDTCGYGEDGGSYDVWIYQVGIVNSIYLSFKVDIATLLKEIIEA